MSDTDGADGPEIGIDAGHHETFDPETDDVAVAVMDTVASVEDVAPMDLEPLTEAVDPDALSTLFSKGSSGISVSRGELVFTHEGYEVTVTSSGDVWVRPPA